jgi:hypothetical protein
MPTLVFQDQENNYRIRWGATVAAAKQQLRESFSIAYFADFVVAQSQRETKGNHIETQLSSLIYF